MDLEINQYYNSALEDQPDRLGRHVVADSDPEGALLLCKQIRQTENPLAPIFTNKQRSVEEI